MSEGTFSDDYFRFIKALTDIDINPCPDSTKFQYHVLYAAWLYYRENNVADDCLYHVSTAISLAEHSNILEGGATNPDYFSLLQVCAKCYEAQGNIDSAILLYERAFIRGRMFYRDRESNEDLRRLKSRCLQGIGELYAKKGHEREARTALYKAFEIAKIDYVPNTADPDDYPIWLLGNYYQQTMKDYPSAIKVWLELLSFFDSKHAECTSEYAYILCFLGFAYFQMGDTDSAINAYERSVEISNTLGIPEEHESSYKQLFEVYAKTGDMEGFASMQKFFFDYYADNPSNYYDILLRTSIDLPSDKYMSVAEELLRVSDHWSLEQYIVVLCNIAGSECNSNPERALSYVQQAENLITDGSLTEEDVILAINMLTNVKIAAYEKLGDYHTAATYCKVLEDLWPKRDSVSLEEKVNLLWRMADDIRRAEQYKESIEVTKRMLPMVAVLYGDNSFKYAWAMNTLGLGQLYGGKQNGALKTFKTAQQILEAIGQQNNSLYAAIFSNIGRAYMLKGDKNAAIEYLTQAKKIEFDVSGTVNSKVNQYLNELGVYE